MHSILSVCLLRDWHVVMLTGRMHQLHARRCQRLWARQPRLVRQLGGLQRRQLGQPVPDEASIGVVAQALADGLELPVARVIPHACTHQDPTDYLLKIRAATRHS
jgi:hypothetical protein